MARQAPRPSPDGPGSETAGLAVTSASSRFERVEASAPGKLILMGEHAAVYGRPAVVAAFGLRTRVELERRDRGVEIDLGTLRHRETTGWSELGAYAEACRAAWELFARSPGSASFGRMDRSDPAHLVKVALGEGARELAADLGAEEPPPLALRVRSELPIGAGFGSSASVAVCVLGALFEWVGVSGAGDRIARAALEVERRQHGRPSGIDHTTVLRGGLLRHERSGGGLETGALAAAGERLAELRVFHTGSPAESTGAVVAAVREQRDRDPAAFDELLDRMEDATRRFEAGLADPAGREKILGAIRDFERGLEEMGVVPEWIVERIRAIERAGGAAKVSGAGTLSAGGAGALLVCSPRRAELESSYAGFTGFAADRPLIAARGLVIEEKA